MSRILSAMQEASKPWKMELLFHRFHGASGTAQRTPGCLDEICCTDGKQKNIITSFNHIITSIFSNFKKKAPSLTFIFLFF
jgi:hypothetical protein